MVRGLDNNIYCREHTNQYGTGTACSFNGLSNNGQVEEMGIFTPEEGNIIMVSRNSEEGKPVVNLPKAVTNMFRNLAGLAMVARQGADTFAFNEKSSPQIDDVLVAMNDDRLEPDPLKFELPTNDPDGVLPMTTALYDDNYEPEILH